MRPCAAFYRIQRVTAPYLKFLYSTDHKVIGLLYGFTSLFFLLVGFILVIVIRWQLAYPGEPVPHIGALLGDANAPGGIVLPEFYNQRGFYTIQTQAEYDAWLADEAALLASP